MAGLQYYFFPTDFLYPRPQTAAGAGIDAAANGSSSNPSHQQVLPLQVQKGDRASAADRDFPKTAAFGSHREALVDELSAAAPPPPAPAVAAFGEKPLEAAGGGEVAELSPLCISCSVTVPEDFPGIG